MTCIIAYYIYVVDEVKNRWKAIAERFYEEKRAMEAACRSESEDSLPPLSKEVYAKMAFMKDVSTDSEASLPASTKDLNSEEHSTEQKYALR